MLLVSLVLFWFFYPRSGFENGDKRLIYFLCLALFLFIFGFYRAFLTPYALQFQNDEWLVMKSFLLPKTLAIREVGSVRITDTISKKGSISVVYEIILKDGDSFTLPSLTHMGGFMEKLTQLNPPIDIKDERSHRGNH